MGHKSNDKFPYPQRRRPGEDRNRDGRDLLVDTAEEYWNQAKMEEEKKSPRVFKGGIGLPLP